jgi:hypothetical protein
VRTQILQEDQKVRRPEFLVLAPQEDGRSFTLPFVSLWLETPKIFCPSDLPVKKSGSTHRRYSVDQRLGLPSVNLTE